MIRGVTGAHILLYSSDPEADRAFFRDVLELRSVDAGQGWLIFAMPPSEAALHPVEASEQAPPGDLLRADLYLMCDDVRTLVKMLESKRVPCSAIEEAPWGLKTTFRVPSGGEIGLYQPKHPTAIQTRGSRVLM